MSYAKIVAQALAGTLDIETAIDRAALLAAVQLKIVDQYTGAVLDVATAVVYTVIGADGARAAEVVTADTWGKISELITAACDKVGATLEVIDGRVINA